MEPDVYQFKSYKEYLRSVLERRKDERGYQARMAQAAGCQPSYLSQVLGKGKTELTLDHAAGVGIYLGLRGEPLEYFLTLVGMARATSPLLTDIHQRKLNALASSHQKLSARLKGPSGANNEKLDSTYYSSWTWMAVHLLTSVPEFKKTSAIAARLNLPLEKVNSILQKLADWQLVTFKNGNWSYAKGGVHEPGDSIVSEANHLNWRARALAEIQNSKPESIHYSSTFTMSRRDFHQLREIVIAMIQRSRDLIEPSAPETLYTFNCDLFEV